MHKIVFLVFAVIICISKQNTLSIDKFLDLFAIDSMVKL